MPTPEEVTAGIAALSTLLWPDDSTQTLEYTEWFNSLDLGGITQAILSAAEAVRQPLEATDRVQSEALARAAERRRISEHIIKAANVLLRDPKSDAIDGYCASEMIFVAKSMVEVKK